MELRALESRSPKRALLVEDEAVQRTLVERALRLLGYEVVAVEDCASAMAFIRNPPAPIDLLVSDFNLPDGDGVQIACEARVHHPEVQVVWVSASRRGEIDASFALGRATFLRKPFRWEELRAAIHECG